MNTDRHNKSQRKICNVRVNLPLALIGFCRLAQPSTFWRRFHLANIFHRLARKGAVAPLGRLQGRDPWSAVSAKIVPGFLQVDRHALSRPFIFFLRLKSG